jgi:hypothetical protein
MRLFYLALLSMSLISCHDSGKEVPTAKVEPENAFQLIQRFQNPPSYQYRAGENVCKGFWSFKVYKSCPHRFHGLSGGKDRLETRFPGVRANSESEALDKCKILVNEYNVSLGVEFVDPRVKLRGASIYDCFSIRSIDIAYSTRSEYCGQDDEINFSDPNLVPRDFSSFRDLGFLETTQNGNVIYRKSSADISIVKKIRGTYDFHCSTCDNLPLDSHENLIDKFVCLMDEFIELEEDHTILLQNKIKRDVRNFDRSTNIPFNDDEIDQDEDDILDLLNENEDELEGENSNVIADLDEEKVDFDLEKENDEEKKERLLKESLRDEVGYVLSCLRKHYSKVMRQDQIEGIKSIENKYNISCK